MYEVTARESHHVHAVAYIYERDNLVHDQPFVANLILYPKATLNIGVISTDAVSISVWAPGYQDEIDLRNVKPGQSVFFEVVAGTGLSINKNYQGRYVSGSILLSPGEVRPYGI